MKYLGPLIVNIEGKYMISAKWAWYFNNQLGVPLEIFEDWVNKKYEQI